MGLNFRFLFWGAAFAVAYAMPALGAEIEELIVTAQHREQNVQDVPITVSVIGGEELAKADINGAAEIALHVPGLSYTEFAAG